MRIQTGAGAVLNSWTVRELVGRIDAFVQHYNAGARRFAWTATADSILAKLQRLLQAISGTRLC
jgi:hypothetical protein